MNRSMWKTTLREIRASFGRYLAIFAIIALGVGLFSGLKVTVPAMFSTANGFISQHEMFDLRLISTLGLTDEDVSTFSKLSGVKSAVGAYTADAVAYFAESPENASSPDGSSSSKESGFVVTFLTVTEDINTLSITAGRTAKAPGELVLDAHVFSEEYLGKKLVISSSNTSDTLDRFAVREFTVVGLAYSPLYLNYERGTSSVGNGSVKCFCCILPEAFDMDVFTDIYVSFSEKAFVYSDEYDRIISTHKDSLKSALEERAGLRYSKLYGEAAEKLEDAEKKLADAEKELADARKKLDDGRDEINRGQKELDDAKAKYGAMIEAFPEIKKQLEEQQEKLDKAREELEKGEKELASHDKEIADAKDEVKDAKKKLADFKEPDTYVLTRDENIGYSCFNNDAMIVDGLAIVFPVFFFLVAALVCVTTMSRMIQEQRTQIGVLKALGYSRGTIMAKYLIYSGSSAFFGCIFGYFAGTAAFPWIIWKVYGLMYGFADIDFVFDAPLFFLSLAVSLFCSAGTTYFSIRLDLARVAAELIRPKAPKNGKRIFLEHVGFIWKHLPFLHKVSVRNVFRYKGRFVMMLLGIGGCTGLLITGFGLRDSITDIPGMQFNEIMIYDELAEFKESMDENGIDAFLSGFSDDIDTFYPVRTFNADPVDTPSKREISVVVLSGPKDIEKVLGLRDTSRKKLDFPGQNEVIISRNVAELNNLKAGDTIVLRDKDFLEYRLTIAGVCDNYINSYAYISVDTFTARTGGANTSPENGNVLFNAAYINIKNGRDLHEAAAALMNDDKVRSVSVNADTLRMLTNMLKTMDYIVILVTVCAAALAFIVLYNLTNINITERIREIATIKVLGFYPGETASYVFRENLALTLLGMLAGIPIGILLHGYVMSRVKLDLIVFDVHISTAGFLVSLALTLCFAVMVDIAMYFKIARINMAESLKSIE